MIQSSAVAVDPDLAKNLPEVAVEAVFAVSSALALSDKRSVS